MAMLDYIICCVFLIGISVLFAVAILVSVAVLVTIAINLIKERKEDGK